MASFTVGFAVVNNSRQTLVGDEIGTVQLAGTLSVSDQNQTIRFDGVTTGATINNSGVILNTAAEGRAIRLNETVGSTPDVIINNSGTIQSNDDAIQQQAGTVSAGGVTITNTGSIVSNNQEAIDFANTGGTFALTLTNNHLGTVRSDDSDAVRIGSAGANFVTNFGTIEGGFDAAYSGGDGIQFEDNSAGTVDNRSGASLSGDRHGINGGVGSNVTVTNGIGATITGRNGSGVGLDGDGFVTNHGTITGAFSDSPGSDINGVTPGQPSGGGPDGLNDGDGDGIDIDGRATIVNYGTIQGTGAGGSGSDGFLNTSEGIAAGGGSVANYAGAVIRGVGLGILIDDSSQGNAPFLTEIFNGGTIEGTTGPAIRIVSNFNDYIVNSGVISGGAGVAIQFGSGANRLDIRNGSSISGQTQGGDGIDTLRYGEFTSSGVTVNFSNGTATGTGGVSSFENVIGSPNADYFISSSVVANSFAGGFGDDRYQVKATDLIFEGAGEGTDTVRAVETFALSANFERLTLIGSADIDGTGNGDANVITGNSGANRLDGGGGLDTLQGGLGDDTYVTDGGDIIIEVANAGTDTVESSVTYQLGVNLENLTLTGTGNINGTGNGLDNVIIGNDGNNVLHGALGSDTLQGGLGDDVYIFSDALDTVVEAVNGGIDTIRAMVTATLADNVERLTLVSGFGDIDATGNAGANTLTGNEGANRLAGGWGNDILSGGLGADTFVFDTALDATNNLDRITDFNAAFDMIVLDSAIFTALGVGQLSAGAFNTGFAASETDDRIIYNTTTGALRYDADGLGGTDGILFAYLLGGPAGMSEAQFTII